MLTIRVKSYMRSNKKLFTTIIAALVIVIILSAAILVIPFDFSDEEVIEQIEPEFVYDDRISPLENQGLVLEVQRIRQRSSLDSLLSSGSSWKSVPSFYFISNIDELEYVSKDVGSLGASSSEILFETWDSMFQENKVLKDVPEEQETSTVTLKIMERVPSGLLGRRSEDVVGEEINVVYNYKTGRWSGDDSFKDADGMGYYLGENFEVWFNLYQIDSDNDGIPYWTEVNILHTNPQIDDSKQDPDGDGIPTDWEWRYGYDPHSYDDHASLDPDVDGLENIEEYQMRTWFADPFVQNMYVEIDNMEKGGFFDREHVIPEIGLQALIERFSQHNIKAFFDQGWPNAPHGGGGQSLPYYDVISQDSGMVLQFYNNYFLEERHGIFRYVIVGHEGNFNHPAKSNYYDTIHVSNSLMDCLKKLALNQRKATLMVATRTLHELGHTLGITPWSFEGCDNLTYIGDKSTYDAQWGEYISVMNYYVMFGTGSWLQGTMLGADPFLDYSDGSNGINDQNDWQSLYLPTFQTDATVIEEAYFEPPGVDKIITDLNAEQRLEAFSSTWVFDENLTSQYVSSVGVSSPLGPTHVNFGILVNSDDSDPFDGTQIRVYIQPDVEPTAAQYVLYKEGVLYPDGSLEFYDQDEEIQDAFEAIADQS